MIPNIDFRIQYKPRDQDMAAMLEAVVVLFVVVAEASVHRLHLIIYENIHEEKFFSNLKTLRL
jgi:hypothetical protein